MHTVLIVDDHPVIRLAVRVLLEKHGLQVVAETDNGVDAIQLVREHEPDVVILDIGIPKLDGLTVISRIKSWNCAARCWYSLRNPQRRSASAVSRSAPVGSSTRKKT